MRQRRAQRRIAAPRLSPIGAPLISLTYQAFPALSPGDLLLIQAHPRGQWVIASAATRALVRSSIIAPRAVICAAEHAAACTHCLPGPHRVLCVCKRLCRPGSSPRCRSLRGFPNRIDLTPHARTSTGLAVSVVGALVPAASAQSQPSQPPGWPTASTVQPGAGRQSSVTAATLRRDVGATLGGPRRGCKTNFCTQDDQRQGPHAWGGHGAVKEHDPLSVRALT